MAPRNDSRNEEAVFQRVEDVFHEVMQRSQGLQNATMSIMPYHSPISARTSLGSRPDAFIHVLNTTTGLAQGPNTHWADLLMPAEWKKNASDADMSDVRIILRFTLLMLV